MVRTTKTTEERRLEIIETARKLFSERGFSNTPVDAIIKEMGVAKGTFYYYFKSKEEILEAIADHTLDQMVAMAEQVANEPALSALAKMELLLSNSQVGDEEIMEDSQAVAEQLHLPANRALHEVTSVQTVLRLSPIFAKIVEQGIAEKVFAVNRPLETMQFLLAGGGFLLDGGLFDFSAEEIVERRLAMQEIIERALGAEPGAFGFMNPPQ
ncbi:MAG: TetR/AcrR family transcriptional regulator [Caldilineaceae bacterium]